MGGGGVTTIRLEIPPVKLRYLSSFLCRGVPYRTYNYILYSCVAVSLLYPLPPPPPSSPLLSCRLFTGTPTGPCRVSVMCWSGVDTAYPYNSDAVCGGSSSVGNVYSWRTHTRTHRGGGGRRARAHTHTHTYRRGRETRTRDTHTHTYTHTHTQEGEGEHTHTQGEEGTTHTHTRARARAHTHTHTHTHEGEGHTHTHERDGEHTHEVEGDTHTRGGWRAHTHTHTHTHEGEGETHAHTHTRQFSSDGSWGYIYSPRRLRHGQSGCVLRPLCKGTTQIQDHLHND